MYKFHVLSLHRTSRVGGPPSHMFVSDNKGRILHVTRGLASMLGSTTKELLAGGCQHAVESLLPQPFVHMHRKWQQVYRAFTVSATGVLLGNTKQPLCSRVIYFQTAGGQSCFLANYLCVKLWDFEFLG